MTKIVILSFAFILAVQAITDEQRKRLVEISRECTDFSKVDLKILEQAEGGGAIADNPKLKAHFFCFGQKAGIQNEKGELLTDVIRQRLESQMKDKSKIEKVIELCAIQKDTPEETAYSAVNCFKDNLEEDAVVF